MLIKFTIKAGLNRNIIHFPVLIGKGLSKFVFGQPFDNLIRGKNGLQFASISFPDGKKPHHPFRHSDDHLPGIRKIMRLNV